ncbi:MAG: DUF6262 family protein [Acidimicrobiales bacterium]
MRADNTAYLLNAARARSRAANQRATDALRRLDQTGTPISFGAVAAEAGVSRSWLYRQAGLRAEIERLRTSPKPAQPHLPAALRASEESLHAQRQALQTEIDRLTEENRRLTRQAELLLGERRADRVEHRAAR